MKRIIQESFLNLQLSEHANECLEKCLDRKGNTIHEGDYVKAVYGEPYRKNLEGVVDTVAHYEDAGTCLKIVTLGGKVLEYHANPLCFEVVKDEK